MTDGKASTKAKRKYNEKVYDRLFISLKKGEKEKIELHAKLHNESTNAFVKRSINETMARDLLEQHTTT